jgi:hypothetical protein
MSVQPGASLFFGRNEACGMRCVELTTSMGAIYDRMQEHMGTSDTPVINVRRRTIEWVREFQRGGAPHALDSAGQRVRSATPATLRIS